MRFIVYGAGGVGGVVGARLFQSGHDVVLIARGEHLAAIRQNGLTLQSPEETVTLPVPVFGSPAEVSFQGGDVVLLAMKCNDTEAAVAELVAAAGPDIPVVCLQNGVEAERIAARRLANVYATPVRLPATHLEPGVVQANSAPYSGVLDIGRYPTGVDDRCVAIAAALEASRFSSRPEPRVMRHKYTKLLGINLGNAIEALTGSRSPLLLERAQIEARACFEAAEIDYASEEEDRERRGTYVQIRPIAGARRGGGSTWQSLSRGKRTVEVDFLNGEIVLLGRLHGVRTPVNALLQERANRAALLGHAPGAVTVAELEEAVG